ncbi:hypothetical protein JCM19231_2027 [Vibrio ishigakensis]|uniref:Uncharacterized protein n=1 Tax=Vibrio ishigakensis TaxID=1481914 RepID=A0A0B8P0D5_9VIBR|nr:hypothetical protein JCM19231_2027 [Vibrio ishigakensis]
MPIPQLTAPGQVESLNQLGSFIYQASEHEMGEGLAACLGLRLQKP